MLESPFFLHTKLSVINQKCTQSIFQLNNSSEIDYGQFKTQKRVNIIPKFNFAVLLISTVRIIIFYQSDTKYSTDGSCAFMFQITATLASSSTALNLIK